MTNYVKLTDFAVKDTLVSGNPSKLIKGSEINDEFNAIQVSIASKADLSSPSFQGNPTAATQALGNNSTRLANTAFVQQEIADAEGAINITGGNISGVNITDVIITDADISGLVAPIAVVDGGTGKASVTSGAVLVGNDTSTLIEISPTTAGNIIRTNGTSFSSSPDINLASYQTSTSGSSIDFTGIPSWVKRVTIMFAGVSTNGSANLTLQVGTSGGIVNTGYLGSSGTLRSGAVSSGATQTNSSSFNLIAELVTSYTLHGIVTLQLLTGNTWVQSGVIASQEGSRIGNSGGSITLSGALDRVKVLTTDTFDAGSINISYE